MIHSLDDFIHKIHPVKITKTAGGKFEAVCKCGFHSIKVSESDVVKAVGLHRHVQWNLSEKSQGIKTLSSYDSKFHKEEVTTNAVDTPPNPIPTIKVVATQPTTKKEDGEGTPQKPVDGTQKEGVHKE